MTNTQMAEIATYLRYQQRDLSPGEVLSTEIEMLNARAAYDTAIIEYPLLTRYVFLSGWMMAAHMILFDYLKAMKEESKD